MDIGSFYFPSTEAHLSLSQSQTSENSRPASKTKSKVNSRASSGVTHKTMVDNKGWRKKIGAKSKELHPLKTSSDEIAAAPFTEVLAAVDPIDRRRHGWRKTITVSRPTTPMTPVPSTPTPEDIEDTRSERSEASTPRRDSKPKLVRYTSLFATHKEETTTGPIFAEPWSLEAFPEHVPWVYIDPIVTMESIHSHLCKNSTVPVPLEYNSGLFQIFDDYRKLRSQKDRLEAREQETLEESREVKAHLLKSEERYEAEIRRLELLIAQGTTGMTGLMKARQGTVVGRKRQHRKTISTDRCLLRYQHMSPAELNEEIKAKSQKVHLHRQTSPSGKMTALSRRLTLVGLSDLPVGTPPDSKQVSALSRKVQSELNLMDLRYADHSQYPTDAAASGTLRTIETVQERNTPDVGLPVGDAIECDALIALKELGTLIACRKGLDVARFVNGVMSLITTECAMNTSEHEIKSQISATQEEERVPASDLTPRPPLRKSEYQSQQRPDQRRRRHFSFEPGDDQVRQLEDGVKSYDSLSRTDSTDSESSLSSAAAFRTFTEGSLADNDSTPLLPSLGEDLPKPSLIPSPVQTVGRVRRENSMSSLQSVFVKNIQDNRHSSRTSIQTAFREGSNANESMESKSRSSSNNNLPTAESPLGSKDRVNSLANRHSTAAMAAARAAEAKSHGLSRSNTRLSTATSSSRNVHTERQEKFENNDPTMRNNVRKKEVAQK